MVGRIIQCLTAKYTSEEILDILSKDGDYLLLPFSDETNWEIKKFADKLKDIVCLLIGYTREQLENRILKEQELGEEWWYYKGRNNSLIPYNQTSKRSTEDLIKPTPRLLLQQIGTDLFRNQLHPNTWVNATFADYKVEGTISIAKSINNIQEINIDLSNKKHRNLIQGEEIHKNISLIPNWIITDVRFPNEVQAIKDRGGITIRINRPCSICGGVGYHKLDCRPSEHQSETALDNAEFDYVIDNNGTIEELIEQVKKILIKEEII